MKISELIEELQKLKAIHGDWDVYVYTHTHEYFIDKADLYSDASMKRLSIIL